ncbi:class Ib ribonucleoside-diphosphate reductase assembly flavoprotein NrdI, partial [Escherichia coli]
ATCAIVKVKHRIQSVIIHRFLRQAFCGTAGAVPRQVIRFLNDEHNRALLRGVIASGNRNFGEAYGRAGDVIARKCGVPWLYRFELMGTQSDIENVRKGVTEFWQRQPQNA